MTDKTKAKEHHAISLQMKISLSKLSKISQFFEIFKRLFLTLSHESSTSLNIYCECVKNRQKIKCDNVNTFSLMKLSRNFQWNCQRKFQSEIFHEIFYSTSISTPAPKVSVRYCDIFVHAHSCGYESRLGAESRNEKDQSNRAKDRGFYVGTMISSRPVKRQTTRVFEVTRHSNRLFTLAVCAPDPTVRWTGRKPNNAGPEMRHWKWRTVSASKRMYEECKWYVNSCLFLSEILQCVSCPRYSTSITPI